MSADRRGKHHRRIGRRGERHSGKGRRDGDVGSGDKHGRRADTVGRRKPCSVQDRRGPNSNRRKDNGRRKRPYPGVLYDRRRVFRTTTPSGRRSYDGTLSLGINDRRVTPAPRRNHVTGRRQKLPEDRRRKPLTGVDARVMAQYFEDKVIAEDKALAKVIFANSMPESSEPSVPLERRDLTRDRRTPFIYDRVDIGCLFGARHALKDRRKK